VLASHLRRRMRCRRGGGRGGGEGLHYKRKEQKKSGQLAIF
jgi:hypothetical protein